MKNWMKHIADDKKITAINMPGTHDSICRYTDFSFISQTQRLTVSEQLEKGVRYFDFRFKFADGRFLANHSITFCRKKRGFWNEIITAEDVVNDCVAFLKDNPSETILFQLKEAESNAGNDFFNLFYEKFISTQPQMWFSENRIPTMGEARGKIILLRAVSADEDRFSDADCCIDFTAYPYVGTHNIDDWRRGEIKKLDGTVYAHSFIQDSYKTEGKEKWGTVTRFLESGLSEDDFNVCYTSCTRICVPRINVKYINRKLADFPFVKKYYGIIATDFITEKICKLIVNSNCFSNDF